MAFCSGSFFKALIVDTVYPTVIVIIVMGGWNIRLYKHAEEKVWKKKTVEGSQEVGMSFHVQALHMMRQWTCEET